MELYGKYQPVEKYSGKRSDGTEYSGETLAGYSGSFHGSVTDMNGNTMPEYMACDYFLTLRNPKNNTLRDDALNFEAWEIIDSYISNSVCKYMPKHDYNYYWQSGFGGDEIDGLVDFFCKEKVELLPPVIFRLYGKSYKLTWHYCGDYDSDDESDLELDSDFK